MHLPTPIESRTPYAFLIHPRKEVASDMGKLFCGPLAWIPDSMYERALANLSIPPLVSGRMTYTDRPDVTAGYMITVPLTAKQLLNLPRRQVQQKVAAAVDKAHALGAKVVGLGGLNAPVTNGGKIFESRQDIGVTNGNAFTAAMTLLGVEHLLNRLPRNPRIAIVGASGSVGTCLTHLLVRRGFEDLLLIARNEKRLIKLSMSVDDPTAVSTSTNMLDVRDADLVILLTSSADTILRSEHLKQGAVVLDDTQPRNTDARLLNERPDVTIIDGGLVEVPGMRLKGSVGLDRDLVYACLAETMLLALDGHVGHYSLGEPTVAQAERMLSAAQRYAQLGFHLAPFRSFGKLLDVKPEVVVEGGVQFA